MPEIPVPEKVTISLRDPDRSLLTNRPSRVLIDLLYIAGPIPASGIRSAETQVHSLVYLAQEFGAIDTNYVFFIARDTGDLVSDDLSWNLNMTALKEMKSLPQSNKEPFFKLTPKAIELLEAVGGPQTIDDEDKIGELAELARNKMLIFLASFIFTKNEVNKKLEDGRLTSTEANAVLSKFGYVLREKLEELEQKFRSS